MQRHTRRHLIGWSVAGILTLVAVGIIVGAVGRSPSAPSPVGGEPGLEASDGTTMTVETVHPNSDPNFAISVTEPAYVSAFFRAELEARVAGPVRYVYKGTGDRVLAGEPLVTIDVPDLEQEVDHKGAVVRQREDDLELAIANASVAASGVPMAESNVRSKQADVQAAEANRSFRRRELSRFEGLERERAVQTGVVEERTLYYQSAEAALSSASAALLKAQAEVQEARAKLVSAQADVRLKRSLIEVARKDRDRSQAFLSYATVTAPFDGVITRRSIDPGSFVQTGASARGTPLLVVERTDIVTVYANIPDQYAPFISRDTKAVIEMNELPGRPLEGRVTRFAPSLSESDRTMRVEVDLFNGGAAAYRRFTAGAAAAVLAGFGQFSVPHALTLCGASQESWRIHNAKGARDPFPLRPRVSGQSGDDRGVRLYPGMYGRLTLHLRSFRRALLVPRDSIVSRGGKPYLVEVRAGKAVWVPVEVEVADMQRAKVSVLERVEGTESRRELTGREEIVLRHAGEVADGQAVVTAPKEDW